MFNLLQEANTRRNSQSHTFGWSQTVLKKDSEKLEIASRIKIASKVYLSPSPTCIGTGRPKKK